MKTQHTQTPWFIKADENGMFEIRAHHPNGKNYEIARPFNGWDSEGKAHHHQETAAFIVKAVNSYEAHEAFVDKVKEVLDLVGDYSDSGALKEIEAYINKHLNPALSKAKGE